MGQEMVGREFGSYRVVAVLGEGGMGAVYRAEHRTIGSLAAIKVLHPRYASDPGTVARFFNEARAVNLVRHQNIVRIVDFVETSPSGPYLVMEYLEGESLEARLSRAGPLGPRATAAVISRVASALDAAHAQGIVHRDLKPANVFLVPDADHPGEDRVKVLDFGIARLGHASATQTGQLLGTPLYMSPEQCHGARHVDARSDLYSLGVIAYECLTGRPPFTGAGLGELLLQHLERAPPALRDLRPSLSTSVERVVLQALEKDPSARPRSAGAFAEALSSAASSQPEGHASPSPVTFAAPTPPPAITPPSWPSALHGTALSGPPSPLATALSPAPVATALSPAPVEWLTPERCPDHVGGAPWPEGDFFAPAPRAIGALRSAATDLSKRERADLGPRALRATLTGLAAGGTLATIMGVVLLLSDADPRLRLPMVLNLPLLVAVVGAVIGWRRHRFQGTCSYVGARGVAEYRCQGRRDALVGSAELCFDDVTELYTGRARLTRNGAYAGTEVVHRWVDGVGLERFSIQGVFHEREKYGPTAPQHLGAAAERAWTEYVTEKLARAVDGHGVARFNLRGGDWLELSVGRLRCSVRGHEVTFTPGDLEPIDVEQGLVAVRRLGHSRKLLGDPRDGFSFVVDDLANASAFFALARRLYGPRVVP